MQQPQQQHHQQQQAVGKPEPRAGSAYASRHQAAEQRRRTRINERLDKLRELVPHAERANTAAFLETVIDYVQELQALLKCGPSHGVASGKPPPIAVSGPVPIAGSAVVVGSGPYGVATPGGGFEVLQSPQGQAGGNGGGAPGGGGGGTIVSSLGVPASLPFFHNGSNGLATSLPFQAALVQGGPGAHAFFQPPQPVASIGAPLIHHAFANQQQLSNSSAVPVATPSAPLSAQFQQQGQPHFDAAQQLALQQMMASARSGSGGGTVSGTGGSSIDQLYLHAASQLTAVGSGFGGGGVSSPVVCGSSSVPPPESVHLQAPAASLASAGLVDAADPTLEGSAAAMDAAVEASRKRSAEVALGGCLPAATSPRGGSDSEAGGSFGGGGGGGAPKRKRTPTRSLA